MSIETFWRNIVLFLTDTNFFRLRTLIDAILNIQGKLICQFCQHGFQRIQRNDWMKFLSYKELELFYRFWTLNEKSLEFLPETSSQLSKLYLRVQATFTGKLFFWKMCKVFCPFCKLFEWASFLSEFFSAGFLKLYSRLPENLFDEELLVWEVFFNSSTIFGFSVLWRQLCCSIVKSALFPRAEQNEGNIILKKRIKP